MALIFLMSTEVEHPSCAYWVPTWGISPSDKGPQMWDDDWMEAGACSEIHLIQNKGGGSLLNTSQGSSGQDRGGQIVYSRAVVGL